MADLPWREWQRRLRRDADVRDVACAIRDFVSDDASPALTSVWRAWCRHEHHGDVALSVVVLLVAAASGAETALASRLLQLSHGDAARDALVFARAAEQFGLSEAELPFATSELWRQMAQVVTSLVDTTTTHAPQPVLQNEELVRTNGEMTWEEFEALPTTLEACVLRNSTDGRAVLQELEQVVALQAWQLRSKQAVQVDEASALRLMEAQRTFERYCMAIGDSDEPSLPVVRYLACEDDQSTRLCVGGDAHTTLALKRLGSSRPETPLDWLASTELDALRDADDCVDQVLSELHSIDELKQLSIRVAAVLGAQLKTGVLICTRASRTKVDAWGRAIRKEVNSLTSSAKVHQLLRLAALDPRAVLDAVLASAVAMTQHHRFFVRLLSWCPLLLQWREANDPFSSPHFMSVIVIEIGRLVKGREADAPIEDSCVFQFLLELSVSSAVLAPDTVVEGVFWKAFDMVTPAEDLAPITRLFGLVLQYISKLSDSNQSCSPELLTKSYRIVDGQYRQYCCGDRAGFASTSDVIDFRDVALLLTESIVRSGTWESQNGYGVDLPMKTLLEVHGATRPGTRYDDHFIDETPSITSALISSIQHALWSLVWVKEDGAEHKRSEWLARVIAHAFTHPAGASIAGASLVQVEIAKMFVSSGQRCFDRILKMIERIVLPIVLAADAAGSHVSTSSTDHEHAAARLLRTINYVVRCWCLTSLTTTNWKNDTASRVLSQTLGSLDRTIELAADDPLSLLQCLKIIGLINSWLKAQSDSKSALRLSSRIEVSAVRILFMLSQLPSAATIPQDEKAFRQSVANALYCGGLFECEAVARFLETTATSPP